ncbi:MAG: hypothetical protein ACI4TW_01180, partial [Prevotella sp.]
IGHKTVMRKHTLDFILRFCARQLKQVRLYSRLTKKSFLSSVLPLIGYNGTSFPPSTQEIIRSEMNVVIIVRQMTDLG